jgi:ABC-type glycerol-3-phosphate transport system substrate-binding protein
VKRVVGQIVLLVMAASALALLAFGPRPTHIAPENRVQIEYWEKWTGLEGQQMKQIVDAFNDTVGKEKGIWVDYVSMSQIDRKTLVSTAAGAPPDVAGLWGREVLQLASMNALEPLDDYAQAHGMSRDQYKTVYYDGCTYKGNLYALPSTVFSVALLWNKQVFADKAAELRAAGLDPDRPPRTLAELDKYAAAIDTWETHGGSKHLAIAGYVPLEPGSFTYETAFWFGAPMVDPTGTRVLFTSPQMKAAYDWIRGYSERIGKNEIAEFRSGFNSGGTNMFDTPQNPFLMGWIAMEQHGPWMSAFIEKLAPAMNRWHVPPDQLQREKDFDLVQIGMTADDVQKVLGQGETNDQTMHWLAGIKEIFVTFADGKVISKQAKLLPAEQRQKYCQWGAAPFPSDVPGLNDVTWAGMDVWVIPRTAKHKKEAFKFLAFASRQDQIEKLASLHCNLSPLAKESADYLLNHPNPYVDVYEELAASPNARPLPNMINWPQVEDELTQVAERSYMVESTTDKILANAQYRVQKELNRALGVPEDRYLDTAEAAPSADQGGDK